MKFDNKKGEEEWYEALYSVITGNPLDGQTEEASFDDEEFISVKVRECK